ncbi:GIY-YIG nuclease family protein [Streptomyces sp. NPDC102451]|uniref:GIY-YIG nuclease family protein n=1 Tax=Streptomyces sp. NPDC102451 TaxID=3366177 RepID=UPI0038088105
MLRQAAGVHGAEAFPGLCYILLFDDESVKIGYSNTEVLLQRRFKDLSRDAKKAGESFEVMAVMAGGCALEAVLHHRFRDDRRQGKGERFRLSENILDYLATAPRLAFPT